ncbi:MAG: HNH endonuclease [Candidatus Sungbacteria bacterium]|nr:HNH endonuclease [Candidatus Sungbacteria bacterium]
MRTKTTDPKIRLMAKKVKGKRARAVIDFILKHGVVTTEDLEKMGYIHPPRAVRDVRENGIPIETIRVKGVNGKSIAAYKFGDLTKIQEFKLGGRGVFSKNFKAELLKRQDGRCAICNERYDEKFLQIDHRIPYEFSGDHTTFELNDFMLLCAECNRKKDRATELGCKNTCFKSGDPKIMKSCFWASPENYTHICMEPIRRADIVWKGEETKEFNLLEKKARATKELLPEYIKRRLKEDEK